MSLTGVPIMVVALVATVVIVTATVLLWSRFGRWRVVGRTAGILLGEALLVLSVGLIANRAEQFYPSWDALRGHIGTTATTAPQVAGRLDGTLHSPGVATVTWHPAGVVAWHLVAAPTLIVPAGYADRPTVTFPVVVDLGSAQRAKDAVTVHLSPSARTSAASLASLPADLGRDVRVSPRGWVIIAPMKDARLAAELIRTSSGRFVALALVGPGRPPVCAVPVAVVRPPGRHEPLPPGTIVLTGVEAKAWTIAADWAAGQTTPPLAPPVVLPSASVPPQRRPGRS